MKSKFEYLMLFKNPSNMLDRLNEGGWSLIHSNLNKFGNTIYFLKRQLINK